MGIRGFDRSLPMALMRAREAVMRHFRPSLAEHDLTEQQWRVLRALADADTALSVGELAERTYLLGPSLSRMLTLLDDRGLIARSSVPGMRAVPTSGSPPPDSSWSPRSPRAARRPTRSSRTVSVAPNSNSLYTLLDTVGRL